MCGLWMKGAWSSSSGGGGGLYGVGEGAVHQGYVHQLDI